MSQPNAPGNPPHPYHVLLIEDDPQEVELYSDLIREVAQCKVDVMSRIESSLDWIARSNYHLVVIDASFTGTRGGDLPREGGSHAHAHGGGGEGGSAVGMNGLHVLEQIKRVSPVTGVILISEQATVEQAVAAIRLGAEDYLKKPFNLESFQLAVKRGLDRKAVFGDNSGVSGFLNLLNSCQMISASLEPARIFDMVRSYLSRELKSDHSAVYSLDGEEMARVDEASEEKRPDRAMEEVLDIALRASNPLPRMIETSEFYRFIDRGQLTPGLFIFRFRCAGKSDYFCVCLSPSRPSAIDAFESRLRMLKAQIEVTGRNIEQYMGVQSLVYVDDATGLYNTRYLNYILDREIAQARSSGRSFAVLFMDADKFKGVNDTHGHLCGTKLLLEMGHQLKRLVREKDTVFRYGGDEFVAVLSPCDLPTAGTVAERIRRSIQEHAFLANEGLNLHFTVSIGVALFPDHAGSKKAIIDAADQAMYSSKRASRNRVTIAAPGGGASAAAVPGARDRSAISGADPAPRAAHPSTTNAEAADVPSDQAAIQAAADNLFGMTSPAAPTVAAPKVTPPPAGSARKDGPPPRRRPRTGGTRGSRDG